MKIQNKENVYQIMFPPSESSALQCLKVIIVVTSKLNMSSSQVSNISSSPNGKQHQKQQSRKKGSPDRNIMITRLISLQVLLLALILHFLVAFVTGNWTGTTFTEREFHLLYKLDNQRSVSYEKRKLLR